MTPCVLSYNLPLLCLKCMVVELKSFLRIGKRICEEIYDTFKSQKNNVKEIQILLDTYVKHEPDSLSTQFDQIVRMKSVPI